MPSITRYSKIIYSACAFSIIALVLTLIASSAQMIHFRMEIANKQLHIESLVADQERLENQLSQSTSIDQSQQLAQNLGFVSIAKTIALQIPDDSVVALR